LSAADRVNAASQAIDRAIARNTKFIEHVKANCQLDNIDSAKFKASDKGIAIEWRGYTISATPRLVRWDAEYAMEYQFRLGEYRLWHFSLTAEEQVVGPSEGLLGDANNLYIAREICLRVINGLLDSDEFSSEGG
jgi:hypothetical protein